MTTQKTRSVHVLLAVIVVGFFAYNVWQYYFLGDDCFIAFRFSKNLVQGHGLVFNPGERVEGYTQLLWVLLMALGMKIGIGPEVFSTALGIACGAGILVVLLRLTLRVAPAAGPWIWVAPLCLAVNRSFCAWSTGGLGTQFFAFLVLVSLVLFAREWAEADRRPLRSGLLFAVTTLARPEGGIFAAAAGLFFLADVLIRRRRPFGSLVLWVAPFVLLVGTHFVCRYAYYGYWLPNTFYAKVSGFWWEQARAYLSLFLRDHLLYLVLPLLLLAGHRLNLARALFFVSISFYVAYIIYIGGDRFEFRFMTPVLPLLYWLLAESLREGTRLLARSRTAGRFSAEVGAVFSVFLVGTAAFPMFFKFKPDHGINSIENVGEYAVLRTIEGKFFRRLVEEGYLRGDELIATRGAGAMPYYSEFPILDLHGLNDTWIAHQPIEERGVVSHEKLATVDYVRERGAVMCNVLNRFVFEGADPQFRSLLDTPFNDFPPYFPPPIRCIKFGDSYILFGTTLEDFEYYEKFRRFEIIR